ncbi:unnamed protein product [Lampetra planeri]
MVVVEGRRRKRHDDDDGGGGEEEAEGGGSRGSGCVQEQLLLLTDDLERQEEEGFSCRAAAAAAQPSLFFQGTRLPRRHGCKPEQQMMYAGSKNTLVQTAELTKVFEIRSVEELTEEWLQDKLKFFR